MMRDVRLYLEQSAWGVALAAVAVVIAFLAAIVWVGVVAYERPACFERSVAMGATNVRWGWRTGCLVQLQEEGPYVPTDLLRDLITDQE